MKTVAVIPAAGKSKRIGGQTPKQFLTIKGKELIAHTLEVFQRCPLIDEIVVATSEEYFKRMNKIKKEYKISKLKAIVNGGKERQDSVFNAISSLSIKKTDLVAVHDAARPLLPDAVLLSAIKSAQKKGNAVVCIHARDTLMKGKKTVDSYINRADYYYVQTPQIFKFSDLWYALELAKSQRFYGTDESMLMKRAGFRINIIDGSPLNFKVTSPDDLLLFKALARKV